MTPETPLDVSIVIVNWNTRELLRKCLESIQGTFEEGQCEIIVVDNGSTDGSVAMLREYFPTVRVLQNRSNLGFSAANNIALSESESRYVCLMNSDIQLLDGCLNRLCDYLDRHPRVGMIAPKIVNPDHSLQISCYGFPTYWNSLCYALGFDRLFPRTGWLAGPYRKYWPCNGERQVEAVSGCFMLARREAIDEVGPLDESFFMYMEDFDWCRRFHEHGWPVVFFPEARAIHYGGGSSGGDEKYWVERNRSMVRYWCKHHGRIGKGYILCMIFLRHLLRGLQALALAMFRPSRKGAELSKFRQSVASLRWLLNSGAYK